MKSSLNVVCSLLILLGSLSSCISQKKINYLQNKIDTVCYYDAADAEKNLIKPNDELYITVSSFDDLSFNFFGSQAATSTMTMTTETSISLRTFTVDSEGNINFPVIGSINVSGLTLTETSSMLEKQLSAYFDQPIVIVKYGYKKITVLGAVQRPGYYTYSKDQLSIFDALGIANDLTVHGDPKHVVLVRNNNDKIEKRIIDLTDDSILFSDYYYLRSDDIVYVQSRRSIKWNVISTPISLFISTVTAAVLTYNVILTSRYNQ